MTKSKTAELVDWQSVVYSYLA